MFACIFFHEDSSLSVVGKNSKRLELQGCFKEKELVKMKWGKSIFSGTIIIIHENEELLNVETVKAERKIRDKQLSVDEAVQTLFDHFKKAFSKNEQKVGRKRERIETERLKESKEQAEQISPKKKKTAQDPVKEKPKKSTKETPKQREKTVKQVESQAQNAASKEILMSSLAQQFASPDKSTSIMEVADQSALYQDDQSECCGDPEESTSLTKTWALCTQPVQVEHDEDMPQLIKAKSRSDSQALPAEVIEIFKLMLKPTVQRYMRRMVSSYGRELADCQDVTAEPASYMTLLGSTDGGVMDDMVPPASKQWTVDCNHAQPSPWSEQELQIPLQHVPRQQTPPPQQSLEQQAQQLIVQHEVPQQQQHISYPWQDFNSQYNPQNAPRQQQLQQQLAPQHPPAPQHPHAPQQQPAPQHPPALQHPPAPQHPHTPQQQPALQQPPALQHPHATQQQPESQLQHAGQQTPLRRSPRKHNTSTPSASDGSSSMTLLLAGRDLSVNREALRKAKNAAKNTKTTKMGFVLASKLLPAVFSYKELADSRGQGLKSKEGDTRPVLDASKMSVLKEYISVWCEKNGGSVNDRDINDAVTEQVSYARKKYTRPSLHQKQQSQCQNNRSLHNPPHALCKQKPNRLGPPTNLPSQPCQPYRTAECI